MEASGRGLAGEAADLQTEAAVLRHVLELHPVLVTQTELIRELAGKGAEFRDEDAIERAARELTAAGLLHNHGEFVIPTRAAMRFMELWGK